MIGRGGPVGAENSVQVLLKVTKDAGGEVRTEEVMPVRFVPLVSG